MTPVAAETLGLKALSWLLGRSDDLEKFFSISGGSVVDLRARASEPEFLTAVVDYLLMNEKLTIAFCADEGRSARDLHLARHVLAGAR